MEITESPAICVFDIPDDSKIVLKDNQRGRILDQLQRGYMVHIVLDDGRHLITDPDDIEACISRSGWVNVHC